MSFRNRMFKYRWLIRLNQKENCNASQNNTRTWEGSARPNRKLKRSLAPEACTCEM